MVSKPEPTATAVFRCINGCAGSWPLTEAIFACSNCGGLLEVTHDLGSLRNRSAIEWKRTFKDRLSSVEFPNGSGVWSKREWVAPHVAIENIVTTSEGGSAIVDSPRYADEIGVGQILLKQCGTSHTGSFKDLGMTVLVSTVAQILANGGEVSAIACASTGDTSAALAAYAAMAGIPAIVILPRGKVSAAQLVQPLANGATVIAIDGDFDVCMKIVVRLAAEEGVYLANSMNSLRLEGQKTVAIEIAQQLGWQVPDWVVIPGGNLGNVSALGTGFSIMRELGVIDRLPRICVAQAERANPLYRAFQSGWRQSDDVVAGNTLASAIRIGAPVSRQKAERILLETDGVVEQASESQLAEAAARGDLHGFFCCPQTGVALAALEKLAANGVIAKSERVVVVSTASGLKFADFKTGYHANTLNEVNSAAANQPIRTAGNYADVREAVLRRIHR